MTTLLLSAYPAAPDAQKFGAGALDDYYRGLRALDTVGSVELPVDGNGGLVGGADTLARVADGWDIVLTTIPGTRARLDHNPSFGLASTSPSGREAAVAFVHAVLDTARRIDQALGRRAVSGIGLVSAPRALPDPGTSSGANLAESLVQVLEDGADSRTLYLEHCDAPVRGHAPLKGYLSMPDEVDALCEARSAGHRNVSALVNWGRSAIEQRSVAGPIEHLRLAQAAGVLGGLVFSGCAAVEGPYGSAWADVHTPLAPGPEDEFGESTSLLSDAEIARCLELTNPDTLIGVKVAARPADGISERVRLQQATLARVWGALRDAPGRDRTRPHAAR